MAKKTRSALHELLSSVRGITVCAVAVYGLFREIPYPTLVLRLAVLWAVLSLAALLTETIFQYFAWRAGTTLLSTVPPPAPNNSPREGAIAS